MAKPLAGRVAIVTGAGQGTGASIATTLAQAGARVAVNDINPDLAERVAATINDAGGTALPIVADVSNKFQCVKLVETTRASWGRLDILVNDASVAPVAPILKLDEWDWVRCLDVNLKGTFFMSQLAGRVLADENRENPGVIVNVASVAGVVVPWEHRAAFCASQAGIVGFARECAREFARYGIRVNTVLTGVIAPTQETPLPVPPRDVPLRYAGDPQAVADVVLFLCTAASRYMTGTTVTVDGGMVMR